ncbi:HAD family hydrolase [Desulfitobacterium sp.]|uniref:HAD family hydrolase n=1 Tax=Desulfitobacterium sp. TaxID=49981 RepID=UPI002B209D9A|nr:HAD family hydrolase [Desulfitobacterium sp.]MEA4903054.1 HAD family hydrolase [Desulfitobacterium sp.]
MQKNYDVILFDLDGTLTDSQVGIINSVQYALKSFGIEETNRESLRKFIGPPLKDSFMEYYQFDEEKAILAITKYREYFSVKGLFENSVYPGIPELLKALVEHGKKLIVATSKPTPFTRQILDHFNLDRYFTFVSGSNLDGTRIRKDEVIAYAVKECGLNAKDNMVMVGDRKYDITGAKAIGIDSIGVLYGFGSRSELEGENPTRIVESVSELKKVLMVRY